MVLNAKDTQHTDMETTIASMIAEGDFIGAEKLRTQLNASRKIEAVVVDVADPKAKAVDQVAAIKTEVLPTSSS